MSSREHWSRDFTGSASVFSILFAERFTARHAEAFVDRLELFQIGMSWGGVTSLALAYPALERPGSNYAGRLVRLNIGLEDTDDLERDLAQALDAMRTKQVTAFQGLRSRRSGRSIGKAA